MGVSLDNLARGEATGAFCLLLNRSTRRRATLSSVTAGPEAARGGQKRPETRKDATLTP